MSARTIKITYNGEDLIVSDCAIRERYKPILKHIPLDRFSYSATASKGGEGFFLCTRETTKNIIDQVLYDQEEGDGYAKGKADLVFGAYYTEDGNSAKEELTFANVYVGPKSRMICTGSGESIFLLHLVDQLWRSTRFDQMDSTDIYNMLMPDGATVIVETKNGGSEWTWDTLLTDILTRMNLVSTTSSLVQPINPKTNVRDLDFIALPATFAMDHACAINGWTFAYNPFTTACTVEYAQTPSTNIETIVADLASRLICGGLMHPEYNYQAYDGNADAHKYIGSDLFSIPLPPATTIPANVRIVFPVRFSDGRYPTAADGSADESIRVHEALQSVASAGVDTDFNAAFGDTTKQIDSASKVSVRDFAVAIRAPTSPFAVQNSLTDRITYLGQQVFNVLAAPRGTLIYDGFHQIAPSLSLFNVCVGVEDGVPFTRLDLERRPARMFGASFDTAYPSGAGIMGVGNNNLSQRADSTWAMHANSPLFPFFDETPAGDLCS